MNLPNVDNGTRLERLTNKIFDEKRKSAELAYSVARVIYAEKPQFSKARARGLIAEFGEVSIEDLVGPSKMWPVVHYRQAGMVALYLSTNLSTPLCAKAFGRNDHTPLIQALKMLMPHLNAPVRASSAYLWFQDKMEKEARAVS